MFSVPDAPGAKVGVIGSGKGMTEVRAKAMHLGIGCLGWWAHAPLPLHVVADSVT